MLFNIVFKVVIKDKVTNFAAS